MSPEHRWGGLAEDAARREAQASNADRPVPGDVVSAAVRNLKEAPGAPTKYRPAVLLSYRDNGDVAILIGLTSKANYSTGEPRFRLASGLRTPSFVFSPRPTFIPIHDLGTVLGSLSLAAASDLIRWCRRQMPNIDVHVAPSYWDRT